MLGAEPGPGEQTDQDDEHRTENEIEEQSGEGVAAGQDAVDGAHQTGVGREEGDPGFGVVVGDAVGDERRVSAADDPHVPDAIPRREHVEDHRPGRTGQHRFAGVRIGFGEVAPDQSLADLVVVGSEFGPDDGGTGDHADARDDVGDGGVPEGQSPDERVARIVHGSAGRSEQGDANTMRWEGSGKAKLRR
ncbi:MAG: hypothetical protein B7C54_08260 [Acidimicrobiales bacterium mtb01]|nr:MAG: hypothetical protein B7C54_08260 [Acidimicrobiales bacterium mtb01]